MGTEIKSGSTSRTELAPSLKKLFVRYCDNNNTNQAEVLRNFIQKLVKPVKRK